MLSLLLISLATAGSLTERSYQRAVDLIDGLYLYPEEVDAKALLQASAEGLADELHWLHVEPQGPAINLQHGDGSLIGSVSVATLNTLPDALITLEDLVRGAGYPLHDADLRLITLQGMTNGLDRYSRVLAGDGLDRFDVRLKGTLVGVGLRLQINNDQLQISQLNEGGPAEQAGLRVGDILMRLDGRSTTNMPTREANRKIRGEEGSEVVFTLNRDGEQLEITVVRAEVVVPNVESGVLEGGIGWVRISHMSQRTVENLVTELHRLEEQDALKHGLIIDLRRNTGGSMKESARTVDAFVDKGMLLRTAGPDGKPVRNLQARMDAEPGGHVPDVPIAILVDERTASGAEILAGALLELDRAVLIGTRTYGKGTVQKIYPLGEGVRLKLTVAQYILENDRHIANKGLLPDVAIGTIALDSYGVHYNAWSPDPHISRDAILPWVQESWGWRQKEIPEVDLPEELARRTLLAATGSSRTSTLKVLQAKAKELAQEQTTQLVEALANQGIDWSPGTQPAAKAPSVQAKLELLTDPEVPDVLVLTGTLTNLDPDVVLHQASIELSSPFSGWDGLSIPIGRLEPGATLSGTVRVSLRPGIRRREDRIDLHVRTHKNGLLPAGSALLTAESPPRPYLSATLHLQGKGSKRRAVVGLKNHSNTPLSGLEVHFAYPGDIDVELLDRASRIPELPASGSHTFSLEMGIGSSVKDVLPLRLVVETPYGRALAHWPVELPLDGTPVALKSPVIAAISYPLHHPTGAVNVPIVITDDLALDHILVYLNGRKIGWSAGEGNRGVLDLEASLLPGENRFDVYAADQQGLRLHERFVIRGIPGDGVVSP